MRIGTGYFNSRCSITVRLLTWQDEAIDVRFIRRRIESAFALRQAMLPPRTTGYRLINGEGDFLPGLVFDVYGDFLVCQFMAAAANILKSLVIEMRVALLSPQGIYEKSEGSVRHEEGLLNTAGVVWGQEPPSLITIEENGCRFFIQVQSGQKTGFFLDQRNNRALVGSLSRGKRLLNGFSYSGGFGIVAAKQGAQRVVSVDSSAAALHLARQNWQGNDLPDTVGEHIQADMFSYLRETTEVFDVIVLDPPPFIRRRQDVRAGVKGYKEINLQALRLLPPGGLLFSFSCSQHLPMRDFLQTTLFAAADARRRVQILQHLEPGADHPINLAHGEGSYLKGVWLRVGD